MKDNKNKVVVFALAFSFLFMLAVVPFVNKGTQSAEQKTDALVLNCSETAISDEEVGCDITLNSSTIVAQGLTIKYDLPEGVEYVGFNTNSFDVYSSDETGVVLVNIDGVDNDVLVGQLKLKMPSAAIPNSIHKIQLVDATIGDGGDKVINLENVYDEIRIKSDINTLDSISLSNGILNESFNKDVLEYTVNTDNDKITINVVKTDDKSIVSGDINKDIALHYGTNVLNILVTSEDGKERIYKVNVYRKYNFTTDKYLYDEEDSYIYVGTDIQNLLNNINVADGLNKNIENDRLIISYNNEKLLEIKILSIEFNRYQIVNNILYVDKKMTAEEFTSNVRYSDGITFDLSDEDKVKVLYDSIEMETYNIGIYHFELSSSLVVDEVDSYIKYLNLGMTTSQLLDMISVNGGTAYICNKSGEVKNANDIIFTGDKLVVYLGDTLMDEYQLSVLGDSSGDGRLSTIDLAQFRKHLVDWINPNTGIEFELSGVYKEAFDLNKDGRISVVDLAIMRKKIVGLIQ